MASLTVLPSKRLLLYDLLLRLSGFRKEEIFTAARADVELGRLKSDLEPALETFPAFMAQLVLQTVRALERLKSLDEIEDLDFLRGAKARLGEVSPLSDSDRESLLEFERLIAARISQLDGKMRPLIPSSAEAFPKKLEELNSGLDAISNKIRGLSKVGRKEPAEEELSSYAEGLSHIDSLSSDFLAGTLERERLEGIVDSVTTRLRHREALFALAQIKIALKNGRTDEKRYRELLISEVKPKLVEGFIVCILDLLGSRTLRQIHEEYEIASKELFDAAKSLLRKRKIEIISFEGVDPVYDILKREPDTIKRLRGASRELTAVKQALSIQNRNALDGAILKCDSIIKDLERLSAIDDELFEEDLLMIERCRRDIDEASRGLVSRAELEKMRDRVSAMINAYERFRLSLVAEKGSFLMEKNVYGERLDEQRYLELLSSTIDAEHEREQILQCLRGQGPSTTLMLAESTGIPPSRVYAHMLRLKNLGHVKVTGEEKGYPLYSVPMVPQKEVSTVADLIEIIGSFHMRYEECAELIKDLKAENVNPLILSLSGIGAVLYDMSRFATYDGALTEALMNFQREVNNWVTLATGVMDRIPQMRPVVSVEDLVPIEVPEVDVQYADLVELRPLLGFGAVDWDGKRCLGCQSCQEICPEAALEVRPIWAVNTIFEMKGEELQSLPESRRMMYQSILNLAKIRPVKPIQLPKEALGFGEVNCNPIRCIACKRCEVRCPNEAVKVKEVWNFPEIMRLLRLA